MAMAMAMAMKIGCMVLACMAVATVTEAITCNDITPKLMGCISYLQKGGAPGDQCCKGVIAVNNLAKTTPDRKTACGCLKNAAKSFNVNAPNAASLPAKCGVRIPYPISATTDCSKIR